MLEPGEGQSPTPSELGKNPQSREYEETAKASFREVIKQGTGTLGLPVYLISELSSPSNPLEFRNPDALIVLKENVNRGDIVEKIALVVTQDGVFNLNPVDSTPEGFKRSRYELRNKLYDMVDGTSGSKPQIELLNNEKIIITAQNGDKVEFHVGSQVEDEAEIATSLQESKAVIGKTRQEVAERNTAKDSGSEQKAIHARRVRGIALGLLKPTGSSGQSSPPPLAA